MSYCAFSFFYFLLQWKHDVNFSSFCLFVFVFCFLMLYFNNVDTGSLDGWSNVIFKRFYCGIIDRQNTAHICIYVLWWVWIHGHAYETIIQLSQGAYLSASKINKYMTQVKESVGWNSQSKGIETFWYLGDTRLKWRLNVALGDTMVTVFTGKLPQVKLSTPNYLVQDSFFFNVLKF